ncbi:tetratricopeptide repeat protein 1-like isoform X1 [Salvelinus alpinus]|uniref:tetratricopeptide repeat protein 1-like isoform X1 n=2 Tax=Salvelinus alpinus TaxID=8036 RepID=UPI0039FCD6A6
MTTSPRVPQRRIDLLSRKRCLQRKCHPGYSFVQGENSMESSADKESEALLDRMTDSLTNVMRVSEQHECPDGQSTAAHRATEQGDDAFFDCEESLDGADGSMGDRQRRTDCSEAPALCQETEGCSPNTEKKHVNAELGEEAEFSGERTTLLGGEEEEEKETWDECTEEDKSMAVEGGDSDTELNEEENPPPEFDEYLRQVEKDMTEEETESRREESMSLKDKGNSQFKSGEHTEAESSYTAALGLCPVCYSKERAILFSNRAAARLHLDKNERAIADCTKAIELNPNYMRAILRRAELYEKTDKLDEALEDYKAALEKDPDLPSAREACMRLPQQIHERNEKLKDDMMGKLKDLGNMFLRPFGLSTSNFQVNQDSGTGSYSVNFVQNPNNNNNRSQHEEPV